MAKWFPDNEVNEQHASDPQLGDYWHEMFCPAYVVVGRLGAQVVVCKTPKSTDENHWTWDLDKLEMIPVDAFKKRLSYETIPGHYWADVVPEAHKWAAEAVREQFGKGD